MSNQIVITSGAKVRSLEGVLTGTSGIVSSVPLGAANGVATLDALGKVPLSQLPASVVTYLGTWNAATNTPTLTNGTGDVGDLYICNVAGTVNFGAGPITFASGDWVIYNGSQWQKSAGSSGTVTSVGLASTAGAFTITNSPITTSGNIGLNFAGNSGQYVAGDGSLVTFPSIITQAQNLVTEVYNQTGATLTKGTVVYINGGHGNLPTITKAIATGDATSAQTYGLVRADITNNNNGYVTVIGNLDNMDTQAYADGTQLYLSSTTAGAYTSVKQYAPAHLVYVGIVVRSHPTQGVIEVRIQNGFELDELHNVSAQTPSNNQGIFYNSSTSLWENKSIATALGYTPADDSLVVKLAGTQTITGQKTFSTTLFGTSAEFSSSILSPIVAILDSSSYTKVVRLQTLASTNRDVYFPDLNGTVALLEGSQTFTGNKTFSGGATFTLAGGVVGFSGGIAVDKGNAITKGSTPASFSPASTTLYSALGDNNLVLRDSTNTSTLQFQAASNYTYTFPATTGTLALTSDLGSYVTLTTAQSISGSKTFGLNNLIADGGILFKATAVPSSYTTGYVSAWFNINGTKNSLGLASSAISPYYYYYDFPNASGTLALTSDLGNYVTLDTTQTITGAKTFTTNVTKFKDVYVEGSGTSASGVNLKQSSGGVAYAGSGYMTINAFGTKQIGILDGATQTNAYISLNSITSGVSRTYTLPDANGTLVLGTGTTNYLPKFTGASTLGNSLIWDNGTNVGIGNTNTTYTFDVTGTGRFTSNLSVTGGSYFLQRASSSAILPVLRYWNGTGNPMNGGALGDILTMGTQGTNDFILATDNTTRINITSSGYINIANNTAQLLPISAGNFQILGGYYYVGGTGLVAANGDGCRLLFSGGNFQFNTFTGATIGNTISDTERMRITSTGNVLIGQTSASGSVNGIYLRSGEDSGIVSTSDSALSLYRLSTNGKILRFFFGASEVGSISTNTNSLPSDLNFKKDITDLSIGLNLITKLRPVHYRHKLDDENEPLSNGIIAQELEESLLECGIEKNSLLMLQHKPVEDEKQSQYWVDYTKMIPILIKSIQELEAKIVTLESKIN
jgi:hypothetical protein